MSGPVRQVHDYSGRQSLKEGVPVYYFVVVAELDGDVAVFEVEPPRVVRRGEICVENQGTDPVSVWESARDALNAAMPGGEDDEAMPSPVMPEGEQAAPDADSLDELAELLRGESWSHPEDFDAVREIVARSGRSVSPASDVRGRSQG